NVVLFVPAPDVVDQQVQTALLFPNPVEQGLDLPVVGVVAADRDAGAAPLAHQGGRLLDGAGQVFGGGPPLGASARYEDGRTGVAQGEGDAPPDAPAGPRDQRHAPAQRLAHPVAPPHAWSAGFPVLFYPVGG